MGGYFRVYDQRLVFSYLDLRNVHFVRACLPQSCSDLSVVVDRRVVLMWASSPALFCTGFQQGQEVSILFSIWTVPVPSLGPYEFKLGEGCERGVVKKARKVCSRGGRDDLHEDYDLRVC